MKQLTIIITTLILLISCSSLDGTGLAHHSDLTLQNFYTGEYKSSTKIEVSWFEPAIKLIIKQEEISNNILSNQIINLNNDTRNVTIKDLFAGTTYNVILCYNLECSNNISSTIKTEEEYWQVHGDELCSTDKECVDSATIVIEDSATAAYAIMDENTGVTTLYTNKKPLSEDGPMKAFGTNNGGTSLEDMLYFEWIPNTYIHVCDTHQEDCSVVDMRMATYQVVPTLDSTTSTIIFEGVEESIGYTQLYELVSQDNHPGIDYNADKQSTICDFEDLSLNNNCAYNVLIESGEDSGLLRIRQSKIAMPRLESGLNSYEDTFMVITGEDICGETEDGFFFATYNNEKWTVMKNDNCAEPIVQHAHGPVLVNTNDGIYKLYGETYNVDQGQKYSITTVTKPFKMYYGTINGFEDESLLRDVHFVWANGEIVSNGYESGFGDHMIYLPDNNLENQIMFLNLNGFDNTDLPAGSPGIGVAKLLNP